MLEPLPEPAVIDQAGLLVNDGAIFEHDEVRDAAHLKAARQLGVAIGVDLQDQRPTCQIASNALHLGSRSATGATPGSPKVYQDRHLRLFYNFRELARPDLDGDRNGAERRFARATFRVLGGTSRGDTVLSTALGTHDNQDYLAFIC